MYKKVTAKEFYDKIVQVDAVLTVKEPFPYKVLFKDRHSGHLYGYSVEKEMLGCESDYYLEG